MSKVLEQKEIDQLIDSIVNHKEDEKSAINKIYEQFNKLGTKIEENNLRIVLLEEQFADYKRSINAELKRIKKLNFFMTEDFDDL